MKTIMRNTKLVMILAFLPALLSAAQAQAVDYKSTYKGVRYEQPYQHAEYKVASTATAPAVGFQSTSAYSGQWAAQESTTPMLNSDGTVNDGAYMGSPKRPGSIRRDGNPGTPDDETEEEGEQQPLGDALLPMMLLLCAYAIYKVSRKQAFKTTGKSE
ncbi:MAG: hypothetical protein IJQ18_10250 [Paludibacteraceae bacterium]|nr:hypothetical protein [Paludibacteraceae bacterium]